ncbi:MAG: cytochrome c biogenesis CcdA family protein [Candidatus Nitrospinota bacterium M3_3B_026]
MSAFFSVWVFCLMQIIPFFLAFMAGTAAMARPGEGFAVTARKAAPLSLAALAGFVVIFSSMGMTTTALSRLVFSIAGLGTQLGGIVVGLIGFYFLGLLTLGRMPGKAETAARYGVAVLFGMAMGFAYKPCVTPTLTKIYTMTSSAATASRGGMLLVFYALGLSTVLFGAGMALAWGMSRLSSPAARSIAVRALGVALIAGAALMLSDSMPEYKRFLVGRFVPDTAAGGMEHDHTGHNH